MKAGASPEACCKGESGGTALTHAVRADGADGGADGEQSEVVAILLECGAEPDAPDGAGMTPLAWAARTGNVAAAQLLLKDDDVISFDVQYERQQLSATNKTGGRAVHTSRLCLEGGSFPEDALQLGADVQAGASVIYR